MPQSGLQIAGDRTQHRKFTVFDAMVLIGATALGLGWTRATFDGDWADLTAHGEIEPDFLVVALWNWSDLTVPYLTLLTITLTLLWLRSPRAAIRKLSRYPGAVACAAVTASVIVTVAFDLLFYLMVSSLSGGHGKWFFWFHGLLSHIKDDLSRYARPRGEAIAVCWVILWMTRRWRAQATWLDRLGRLVAVIWLIISVPHFWFALSDPRFNPIM